MGDIDQGWIQCTQKRRQVGTCKNRGELEILIYHGYWEESKIYNETKKKKKKKKKKKNKNKRGGKI